VNETKSARYHRAKRRAGAISVSAAFALLAFLLWLRPELPLGRYVLLIVAVHELVALPAAFYSSFILERRYDLSTEPFATWLKDHLKAFAILAQTSSWLARFPIIAGWLFIGRSMRDWCCVMASHSCAMRRSCRAM
jgi:hypothetical protein